jgi:quercetin dioxygenase-like cupin family protein
MLITFPEVNFKFVDDRGELIQLVREGYNQVNYITAKKGSVRGGHFHKLNQETFFVISGEFTLDVSLLNSENKEIFHMKSGDFFSIPKNVLHSFNFTEDTQLISLYDLGVENKDGTKDIFAK